MWRRLALILTVYSFCLHAVVGAAPQPTPSVHAAPPVPPAPGPNAGPPPAVEPLGEERYRIGAITVVKAEGFFTVPGTVIRREAPLEFVATAKGGLKNYESLLELDADAVAFNLACILIGLDSQKAKLPRHHFDPEPTQGDPVTVQVSWESAGKTVSVDPAELFMEAGKPVAAREWVYTGSGFLPDGRYMAAMSGSLISFVHDPESVIQHRVGIGLNNYGGVQLDAALAPPVGAPVRVTVRRLKP